MPNIAITQVLGREILDSRGRPTVEVDVELSNGVLGRAAVPSGASVGASEAHELRDNDPQYFDGLGVWRAVAAVNQDINAALRDFPALEQRALDTRLRKLDGTDNLSRLGANAVLATSMAACRAAATAAGQTLHGYVAQLIGRETPELPMPLVNILSGGRHARNGMDVQDLQIVPISAGSIREAIQLSARVRTAADKVLARRGYSTLLADEGGLSPASKHTEEALDLVCQAIEAAGLKPGIDIVIAIDVAASSLQTPDGQYRFAHEGVTRSSDEVIELLASWVQRYPIASIEDGLGEEDWSGWRKLTDKLGSRIALIGDDLFTTHEQRLRKGIDSGVANAVLVKVNQNGTISGTLDVIRSAEAAGYATIVSARSGETSDTFIADFATGTAAGYIKIGSLRNSERLSKYNQLMRIAEDPALNLSGARKLRHA